MLNLAPEVLTGWQSICSEFGNGNCAAGYQFLLDLAAWLHVARVKHPKYARMQADAICCVENEWREATEAWKAYSSAIDSNQFQQQDELRGDLHAELRDVIVTIIRFLNREYGA